MSDRLETSAPVPKQSPLNTLVFWVRTGSVPPSISKAISENRADNIKHPGTEAG